MATQTPVPAKTLLGTWGGTKAERKEDGSCLSSLLLTAKSQSILVLQVPQMLMYSTRGFCSHVQKGLSRKLAGFYH